MSAASSALLRSQNSFKPGEPISSLVSTMNVELKPSLPRSASTAASAARLIECWPLLSAVPRADAAMAMAQHRGRRGTRAPPADQEGPAATHRVVVDRRLVAHRGKSRGDLLAEVPAELGKALGHLTLGMDCDAARQIGEEA